MAQPGPTPFIRWSNRLVTALIRAGIPMGSMALITIPGRRTGRPRSTPVSLALHEDGWRLASPFGPVDWVKNLRASGTAQLTSRRTTVEVTATEMTPHESAPLLRQSLADVGPIVRWVLGRYFDTAMDASEEDWVEEARRHPSFMLLPCAADGGDH